MSDSVASTVGDVQRVLVVGDASPLEGTIEALSTAFDPTAVIRARTVSEARDRLADTAVDCLVCAFEPNGDDAILRTLAAETEDVPIVAVTADAGAERALEAGATDVLEPDAPGRLVATRVKNATRGTKERASDRDRRYRSILASAETVVWVLESDGTIAYASPAVERRLGYTPSELERTPLSRLVHPDDRDEVQETIRTVATGAIGSSEQVTLRLGRGDGTWRVASLTAINRLDDPHVEGVVATATEVPAGGRSDDEQQAALDRLDEPVFTLGPNWELQYANDAARRFFDGDPEPGTVVWSALSEPVRERLYERAREASATQSVVQFGTAAPSSDGRFAVTVAPDDDGVTVLVRDLPADATTGDEGALSVDHDRLALLESTVDTLADGIAVLEEGTIRFANATLTEWAGGDPLVGRDLEGVFAADLAAAVGERAASALVRWMEPIAGRLAVGPEPRPVDVFVAPLPADDRTLCVVRDRRRSGTAALSTVQRTAGDLRRATTRRALRQIAVDGIVECTDAEYVGWYRLDEGLLRPAATATADTSEAVEPPPIAYEGTPIADVLERDDRTVLERTDLGPILARAGIRAERVLAVPLGEGDIILAASTDPFPGHHRESEAVETIVETAAIALDRLESRDRVRDCRRDRTRLEDRVSQATRLQTVEREILAAETTAIVERRLCEGVQSLADDTAGEIALAWVGRVDAGTETITPRTWAGPAVGGDESLEPLLESLSISVDPETSLPTGRAAASRESTTVTDLETEAITDAAGDWYRELRERGVRAAVSVPIDHDRFQYGTLTVYADRAECFDERTRQRYEQLATVAGHAISSIRRTRALLADTITELEVALEDDREPLSAIVTALDRRLDVRTVVPRSSGGSTVYCTIPDVDADSLRALEESVAGLESVRHVGADANGSPVEFVLETTTVAETVAEHGGRVRSLVPDTERTRLVIELSSAVDVRPFVSMLDRTHPGATLLARREHDRSTQPRQAFDAQLRERLSERQLRTLETAYYSGFFEWPRESTGEEVADSLGVSQPTFSRHFRTAQRKLFELLFEERLDTGGGTIE